MKIKESPKTAHIAWSPSKIYPCYLVTGTAAQQLDASFSTNSCLELHNLDLSDSGLDLRVEKTINTESRFNKLLWSNYSNNLIIGGCEDSKIYLYDYEALVRGDEAKTLVSKLEKHTGVVAALDCNPFQSNLLASGAGAAEIYIWDLNSPSVPMTPGTKAPPLDDIQCVAWNQQVQHILASTCAGKCAVWDLRKNESILKISDSTSKLRAKNVLWHPDVATQMCLASEDDHSPQLQMWDLRFATSPVKLLEGHQRGVITFSWCGSDSNLLISCGKDNKIICWNPNTSTNYGEIIYEIPSSQWCFDVSWCNRHPQLIATASYESLISVYSLMGGKYDVKPETNSKIMDSFGVHSSAAPLSSPVLPTTQVVPQLKIPPKWMKRACGATFGFGGKLVTFGDSKIANEQHKVNIFQVVTDNNLVEKSLQLESAIANGQFSDYCKYKIDLTENEHEKDIWRFIGANFDENRKAAFISLLGFNETNLKQKITQLISENSKKPLDESRLSTSFDSHLKLDASRSLNGSMLDEKHGEGARPQSPINLCFQSDAENLMSQSLLLGYYDLAVELCISENRYSDAILIASYGGAELFKATQQRYFKSNHTNFSKLLEGFLNQDWVKIISNANLTHWKEALAALLTYTDGEALVQLCNMLGQRLEDEAGNEQSRLYFACICYICSSDLNNLVKAWYKIKTQNKENSGEYSAILQDLIEKATMLRYSMKTLNNQNLTILNEKLVEYAKLLAEQGCFITAFNYLKDRNDESLAIIKDRLYNSIGQALMKQYGIPKPDYPFKHTQVHPQQQQHHQQHQQPGMQKRTSLPTYAKGAHDVARPSNGLNTSPPNTFFPSAPQQPPQLNQSQFYTPPSMPQQTYQPPNVPHYQPPINTSINPPYQSSSSLPPPPNIYQPPVVSQAPPGSLYQPTEVPAYNPTNTGPRVTSYQDTKPDVAWNDPPVVTPKVKPPPAPKEAPIPQNMTFYQPTLPTNPPSTYPNSYGFNQTPMMSSNVNAAYGQQAPVAAPPSQNFFNPMNAAPPSLPAQNLTERSATPQIVEKVQKAPIPDEHLVLQSVFDTLVRRCGELASSPAVKRKLDDASKKLEVLYDKLRDQTLSQSVLQGLHAIVQCIQAFDYVTSLQYHSQVVATSTFSEISAFMPSVKVLIQLSQQMNVTVQ